MIGFISSTGITTALRKPSVVLILKRGGALLTLEEELNAAQAALDLADAGDHAHRVQLSGAGSSVLSR